jgi:hypothetical protein
MLKSQQNMFVVNENGRLVLTGGVFSKKDGQSDRQGVLFHSAVAIKDVGATFRIQSALTYQCVQSVNSATAVPRGNIVPTSLFAKRLTVLCRTRRCAIA